MGDASTRSRERRIAILGYHKIGAPPGDWNTWFYIPEAVFEGQLRWLVEHHWRVIDAGTFLRGLDDPEALPERSALITFDDGYRSNLEIAAPLLLRFGYPGVIFVPTSFIGGYNAFDADLSYEPREPICSWDELRALERKGISVQSHGATHRRFSEFEPEEQAAEVITSKDALEARLGGRVELLSFPYGDAGPDPQRTAELLAGAGYRAGFLYGGGPIRLPADDRYRLARIPMGADTDLGAVLQQP